MRRKTWLILQIQMLNGQGILEAGGKVSHPILPSSFVKLPPGTSFASLSFSRKIPAASSSWSIQVLMDHHLCAKPEHLSPDLLRLPSNLKGTKSLLYPLLNSTEVVWLLELGVQWGTHMSTGHEDTGWASVRADQPPLPYCALVVCFQISLKLCSGV